MAWWGVFSLNYPGEWGEKKRRMDLGGVVSTTELTSSRGDLMLNVLVYLA